jgi:hypothetical protein
MTTTIEHEQAPDKRVEGDGRYQRSCIHTQSPCQGTRKNLFLTAIPLMNTSVLASRQRDAHLDCTSVRPQSPGHSKVSKRSQKGLQSPLTRTDLVRAESGIAPFTRLAGRIARMIRTKTERQYITEGACPKVQGHNICITIMMTQWTWN